MKKHWKLILAVFFLIVIILLNYTGIFSVLSISFINQNNEYILSYVDSNFYFSSLLFMLVYIVAVVFSIPGAWLLTVSGGYLFGWLFGGIFIN